ncbi:MAG: CBS domain-containing protein [Candidatus Aenigmarchaeota archaeon]|nr:CBS domain-containing protein [Candidatus Aenigmarchaeota archaeon]
MIIEDIMKKNVKTCRPDSTVLEAVKIMNKFGIGCLIVVEPSGRVAGIMTERDVLKGVAEKNLLAEEVFVKDIMSTDIVAIEPGISLEEAAEVMAKYRIKKLPVIKEGELVGIVTASDLITYEHKLIEKVAFLLAAKPQAGVGE